MSAPTLKTCPQCRNASGIAAKFCAFCGHAFRTQFVTPPSGPSTSSAHSIWRAVGLSILPGLGQAYNGQALKGGVMWGIYFLTGCFLMVMGSPDKPSRFFGGIAVEAFLGMILIAAIDAAIIANRVRNGEKVGPFETGAR